SEPIGSQRRCAVLANFIEGLRIESTYVAQFRDQLRVDDEGRVGRRVVAHAAGGPLRTAVAALAIRLGKKLAPGGDIGIGGRTQRGNGGADAGLYVGFDGVP